MRQKPIPYPRLHARLSGEFMSAVAAFEQTIGLDAMFSDLGSSLTLAGRPIYAESHNVHRSAFCMKVKETRHPQCIRSHQGNDIPKCHQVRDVFVTQCHARAREIVVPVYHNNQLVCVVYLGQYAVRGARTRGLRPFTQNDESRSLLLARHLQGFLLMWVIRLAGIRPQGETPLAQRVLKFLRDNLRQQPGIHELSQHLSLSPSRTRHLVRECTGLSFREIMDNERLTVAKSMLINSDARLAFVGAESGFTDVDYFCRFFKKKAGMTPGEFREQNVRPGV